MVIALIVVACGPGAIDSSTDSHLDTALSTCAPESPPSGAVVGQNDCEEGRCRVREGRAWLGSSETGDACPQREVWLGAFSIDQREVSAGAYDACVAAGGCTSIPESCHPTLGDSVDDPNAAPVVCVAHADASAFCEWSGGRLPSEAEWEKAARGDEGSSWPWGELAPDCERANYRAAAWYCYGGLVEVGSIESTWSQSASPYGLVDMAGNAWEWVADWYDAAYYRSAPTEDPPGPEEGCRATSESVPGDCSARVIRGGAFNTTEGTTRAWSRAQAPPNTRDINLGFRCAYSE